MAPPSLPGAVCLGLLATLAAAKPQGSGHRRSWAVASVRGGETAAFDTVETTPATDAEREWVFTQVKALQLKLAYLSDALQRDGVNATTYDCREPVTKREPAPVVWQVSQKEDGDGKRCLLYGDTEDGAIMVAPRGSDKWVTLHELNRVRRDGADGARQVSDLWYQQYAMRYEQLMGHLPWKGVAAAMVLNHPHGVKLLMGGAVLLTVSVVYSWLEAIVVRIMTSGFVWRRYHIWAQFLYWPLPMKLVVYRIIAVYLWRGFRSVEKGIHDALVDQECDLLEESNRLALEIEAGLHAEEDAEMYEGYEDEEE